MKCVGCLAPKCGNCKFCQNPKIKKKCTEKICRNPIVEGFEDASDINIDIKEEHIEVDDTSGDLPSGHQSIEEFRSGLEFRHFLLFVSGLLEP